MDIKEYRKTEIPMLLLGCTLILFFISGDIKSILENWYDFLSSAFLGSIVSIFVFIGDGLISSKQKDDIIYLWGLIPQPGETVFDKVINEGYDKRYTAEDVRKRYGSDLALLDHIDDTKAKRQKENSIWYSASNRVRDITKVLVSHRDYLMSRDMFFAVFEYLILYIIFCLFVKYSISKRFVFLMLILLAAIRLGVKNKAEAFVDNVIAVDISEWKNTNEKKKVD